LASKKSKKLLHNWLLLVTTTGYYWLLQLVTTATTNTIGYYNWGLLVTTLGSAHIRSGKRKPLFDDVLSDPIDWVLLIEVYTVHRRLVLYCTLL
jgi:hypothetical protein